MQWCRIGKLVNRQLNIRIETFIRHVVECDVTKLTFLFRP
jgi:hypothetical protein